MSDSKNDIAWNKLFEKHKILEKINANDSYQIKASEIKEFRESRLMTKFDYKSQLPKIFANNNLSILPISRGVYIISCFETFHDFESNELGITKMDFPNYLESIDFNNITSESTVLNCAYVSGIIADFVKDGDIKPTVSGRMSSLSFDFKINSKQSLPALNIKVKNAQIEIDGGYEGDKSLNLIEVKTSISKDFIIRQLFYPFKLWSSKIFKKVRPLFLTYSNGIFHFREYKFEDPTRYNSLRLLREKKYAILRDKVEAINLELIQKILERTHITNEPEIPFPQANSFERVINLCELLNENKELNRETITENYDFDIRQTDYYGNAGKYLGLVDSEEHENKEIIYSLTKKGKYLFTLSIHNRQIKFIELILSHLVFKKVLNFYLKESKPPIRSKIVEMMKESHLHKIKSETTFERRYSTILSWINWIFNQIEGE